MQHVCVDANGLENLLVNVHFLDHFLGYVPAIKTYLYLKTMLENTNQLTDAVFQ